MCDDMLFTISLVHVQSKGQVGINCQTLCVPAILIVAMAVAVVVVSRQYHQYSTLGKIRTVASSCTVPGVLFLHVYMA
jgi:hypothetical protein